MIMTKNTEMRITVTMKLKETAFDGTVKVGPVPVPVDVELSLHWWPPVPIDVVFHHHFLCQ